MPGPSDLISGLQDEGDPFESAEEFRRQAQQEVNRAASKRLSPSQQERLDFNFNTEEGSDGQLLMQQYDLLKGQDQYRFEQFAGRDEVDVVSTNMEWTEGNEKLMYFVMYHVDPGLYNRMRRREIENPSIQAIPSDETEGPSSRGGFEHAGHKVDQWIAAIAALLVSIFSE